ncbi:flagellar export protein FliJ [Aquaspirillum serpens]|uniref:flagellar export protein FliJ n=1 Tax=Aquaspirillum serpens TaxID=190 RepID=UPI0003B7ABD5|nr:flagellar export protein FliJ [Aquaspirillum serpens]
MPPPSKYQLLIRLAQEKLDAAANRMGMAQQSLSTAQRKLQQVESFLAEYRNRRIERGAVGIGVAQWLDYQRFLERLESAVEVQLQEVKTCEVIYAETRELWQTARQHLKAMETLHTAEQQRLLQQQMRREQKQTDELATRAFTVRSLSQ